MRTKTTEKPLSAGALIDRLRERYPSNAYALMEQVGNSTGYEKNRSADAIVFGLWPSRGLFLEGFELKSSRSDWLRELHKPEKAESIASWCDYWWIVTGADNIVQPGELPPTWGLLVPDKKGLRVAVQAPKREPQPLTRQNMAAIFRAAIQCVPKKATIDEEVERKVESLRDTWTYNERSRAERAEERIKHLEQRIADFEQAAGIGIDRFQVEKNSYLAYLGGPKEFGAAVRFVLEGKLDHHRRDLLGLRETTERVLRAIDREIATDPQVLNESAKPKDEAA